MWKALYYSDYDALKKKNLTTAQKRALIWTKEPIQNQFKVFNTPLVSDNMVDADDMIQLRMFEYSLIPVDRLHATILFEIDVYTNDKSSTIVKMRKGSFSSGKSLVPSTKLFLSRDP